MPSDARRSKSGRLSPEPAQGHAPPSKRGVTAIAVAEVPTVYLTTFWRAKHLEVPSYSIAHNQPDGFTYDELEFFLPKAKDNKMLSEQSKLFRKAYDYTLRRNSTAIVNWLESLTGDVALVCWCKDKPHRMTRCSRILVGLLIARVRPDIRVNLDIKQPAWR